MKSLFRWSFLVCVYLRWSPMFWLPKIYFALIRVSRFTRLFGSHHAIAKLDFLVQGLTGDCQRMASSWLQSTRQETQDGRDWRDLARLVDFEICKEHESYTVSKWNKVQEKVQAVQVRISILSRCLVRFWSSRLWRHPGRALLWQQTFEALQAKASEHEIHEVLSIGRRSEDKSWKTLMFKNLWCFDM